MRTAPRPAPGFGRQRSRAFAVLAAVTTATALAAPASAVTNEDSATVTTTAADPVAAPAGGWTPGNYVVTFAAPPVASYTGGTGGLAATKPAVGRRLDPTTPAVKRYRDHLLAEQDAKLRTVGARARYRYTVAANGVSAVLTAAQAARLAGTKGVLAVTKDVPRSLDTTLTPSFLGLSGKNGVWSQLGGRAKAGKGVVVGILDSGITPENPMFAGSPVTRTVPGGIGEAYRPISGGIAVRKQRGGTFVGACQAGPSFPASTCNSTLVSARFFADGFVEAVPAADRGEFETLSPRDSDGHGTHTASTAVGRRVPNIAIRGRNYGEAAGMAPGAALAVYKVCWEDNDPATGNCYTSDSVRAIDQAVIDGVDVINFSISGSLDTVVDPVELAFLHAASAGVFVAASAGNSGSTASTVAHNSPWLTTVAASTAHRFEGTVLLGNGTKLRGASLNETPVPATAAVLSTAVGAAGADATDVRLCAPNSLDPAKAAGKVVICDRGVVARVDKSAEVKRAGGVAMVLTNPTVNSLDADSHAVPTVHLDVADRATLQAYLASTTAPTVAIQAGDTTGLKPTTVPQIAGFSSRGPALANDADILKPDISAPGVSIVAAVAPGPADGNQYGVLSGTSMSSPHIAGLAALVFAKHPSWSPSAVKSAMMTTAYDLVDAKGAKATDPFAQGAGHVRPGKFLKPGLVYDAGVKDWLGFLEGLGLDTQSGIRPIDASNVNMASIAIGQMSGTQTVTRKVTANEKGTYTAKVSLPGVKTTVKPATLKFTKVGQTKSFTVSFTRTTATVGAYATGFLTWSKAGTTVRSPIAVKPVNIAVPAEVQAPRSGIVGSASFTVTPGVRSVGFKVFGLTEGSVKAGSVVVGAASPTPVANPANAVFPFTVPAGTLRTRVEVVAGAGAADLDLYVFNAAGALIASSASNSAGEVLDFDALPAGSYTALVNGFALAQGATAGAFELRTFAVPGTSAGNLTVTPNPVTGTPGTPVTVRAAWSGLTAGKPYLGVLEFDGGARTAISIG